MAYYEDEIPKELIKGNTYTERQVIIFLENNENATIVSDFNTRLDPNGTREVTVYDKKEGFVHRIVGRAHMLPKSKSIIYFICET